MADQLKPPPSPTTDEILARNNCRITWQRMWTAPDGTVLVVAGGVREPAPKKECANGR